MSIFDNKFFADKPALKSLYNGNIVVIPTTDCIRACLLELCKYLIDQQNAQCGGAQEQSNINEELIVWWLSANELRGYDADMVASYVLPDYIKDELISLQGRNGRGRLWVNKIFNYDYAIYGKWPANPLTNYIKNNCGGIVIKKSDYEFVKNFPGIFTDLRLNRI